MSFLKKQLYFVLYQSGQAAVTSALTGVRGKAGWGVGGRISNRNLFLHHPRKVPADSTPGE